MAKILLPSLLLFLLLLLSPPLMSSSSAATDTTVVDYFGRPVEAGTRYYFFFAGTGYFFGSLTMMSKPNQPNCPQFVAVSPYPSDFGPGVELYPIDATQKTITLSSDLNIAFAGSSNCSGKPVWKLTTDKANDGGYVTTNGVIGDEMLSKTWFKIEKADESFSVLPYKVRFCPDINDIKCGDLGLSYVDETGIWLSLGIEPADPFRVAFWPASIKPPVSISEAHAIA